MNRVLLDLNIALGIFLARQPWSSDAEAIWIAKHEGRFAAHFASVSVPTLFYVVRKRRGLVLAHRAVVDCLDSLTIITVGVSTLRLAVTGPGTDFEDNLQIASAVEAGVDAIVTRDPKGFVGSSIPFLSPTEFLALIAQSDGG